MNKSKKLIIATCQFPVDADIRSNNKYILEQMRIAKSRHADIAHFPEAALSGYAGTDFSSFEGFDWNLLEECAYGVMDLAKQLCLWVILGSAHRLDNRHKPHNSLYIIDNRGKIIDRYDKMFCAGDKTGKTGDLAHYSPGNHFCVFTIGSVRCGTLICHDFRYPELYREYKRKGVRVMFHSFHAGRVAPARMKELRKYVGLKRQRFNPGATIPGITMPAAMIASSSNNYMWISCPNTSALESLWPAFFLRPDGVIYGRLRRNITGVLISAADTEKEYYDSTIAWRDRAMNGVFHSGKLVRHPRSDQRTQI